jgi:hypothetical protein
MNDDYGASGTLMPELFAQEKDTFLLTPFGAAAAP